ncbi:MAG TPA: D-alanyl-D-alanine carboxypeptidase/D-alanyl-D-alanine-endopeptidase [Mycobacteriales bacterium]
MSLPLRRLAVAVVAVSALLVPGASAAPDAPVLAPLGATAPVPSAAAVTTALAGPSGVPALGGDLAGEVVDARSGSVLWQRAASAPHLVASTQKLLVAAAALSVLGPGDGPVTTLLTAGAIAGGVLHGDLYLRGGGDVLLQTMPTSAPTSAPTTTWPATASLDALAAQLAAAGVRTVTGSVVGDGTLFTGPAEAPGWRPTYVSQGSVAPVTALEVDHGRIGTSNVRSLDPATTAAGYLRGRLQAHGITVEGGTRRGGTPAGAVQLAAVTGAPVAVQVQEMLENSDNDLAESLGRRLALALHLPPTFAGASAAIMQTLSRAGLPIGSTHLTDASGLSRDDGVTPQLLTAVLRAAATTRADWRPLLVGLPVAAFSGTLADRDTGPAGVGAAGVVRAKTGNIEGVTAVAGTVVDAHGRLLLFSFVTDRAVGLVASENALDVLAGALVPL